LPRLTDASIAAHGCRPSRTRAYPRPRGPLRKQRRDRSFLYPGI